MTKWRTNSEKLFRTNLKVDINSSKLVDLNVEEKKIRHQMYIKSIVWSFYHWISKDSIGLTSFEAWYGAKIQVISDEIPLAPCYITSAKSLDLLEKFWMWRIPQPLENLWQWFQAWYGGQIQVIWMKFHLRYVFLPNSLSETTFISAKSLDLLENFWMWRIPHTLENLLVPL